MPEPAATGGRAPWVIVAPGVHARGGMERANLALARHLADTGVPVHLVSYDVDEELAARPGVEVHRVARPAGSYLVGERLLDRRGRAVATRVTARWPGSRVVVNGGNCAWPDVNWVHCVHHAWPCVDRGSPAWFRLKNRVMKGAARRDERRALAGARVVLANSDRTREHLVRLLGVRPERVHTVYLGSDPRYRPATELERSAALRWLGRTRGRPVVAFVGALGHDHNKGLDTLLAAWRSLCSGPDWDADLVVAGGGRAVERWRAEVSRSGLADRVRLLGFTDRVPDLLAAADLLVSPARYEAYGLNVQEAVCRGVPALVSARAGIAERYPAELRALVLPDPEDVEGLAAALRRWRADMDGWRERFAGFGETLRAQTWDGMARAIVAAVEGERASRGAPLLPAG
jgi:glycosyltransferase involved in cell wall biosynthesis